MQINGDSRLMGKWTTLSMGQRPGENLLLLQGCNAAGRQLSVVEPAPNPRSHRTNAQGLWLSRFKSRVAKVNYRTGP